MSVWARNYVFVSVCLPFSPFKKKSVVSLNDQVEV